MGNHLRSGFAHQYISDLNRNFKYNSQNNHKSNSSCERKNNMESTNGIVQVSQNKKFQYHKEEEIHVCVFVFRTAIAL